MEVKEYSRSIKVDEDAGQGSSSTYRPEHYAKWEMEPWTFIMLNNIPFAEGNVIKYIMRWRSKNGLEDLQKARRIIDMLIEMETNREDYTPKKGCL